MPADTGGKTKSEFACQALRTLIIRVRRAAAAMSSEQIKLLGHGIPAAVRKRIAAQNTKCPEPDAANAAESFDRLQRIMRAGRTIAAHRRKQRRYKPLIASNQPDDDVSHDFLGLFGLPADLLCGGRFCDSHGIEPLLTPTRCLIPRFTSISVKTKEDSSGRVCRATNTISKPIGISHSQAE